MGKGRKGGRDCSVKLKKGKLLLSAAAGELLSGRAGLYERAGVMALVPAADGELNLLRNSTRSTRKDISCQSLYSYLLEKYQLCDGGRLSAWYDARGVLLFGVAEPQGGGEFDIDRFTRLAIPIERNTNCSVFLDHGVLVMTKAAAARLHGRVRVYEQGAVLCIAPDPSGVLEVRPHMHSAAKIASTGLARYVRCKYGGCGSLPGRICGGRFYFSDKLPGAEQDFCAYLPLEFHMTLPAWVTLQKNGVVRLSAGAAERLPDRVALYERADVLALAGGGADAPLKLSRRRDKGGATLAAASLGAWVRTCLGCGNGARFHTVAADGVVFFSRRPIREDELDLGQYRPSGCVRPYYAGRARLSPAGLYVGRAVREGLGGPFRLFRAGPAAILAADPEGPYRLDAYGRANSAALSRLLCAWLGCGERAQLRARPIEEGLLLTADISTAPAAETQPGEEHKTAAVI